MIGFTIRDALPNDEQAVLRLIQALNEDSMRFEPYMPGIEPAVAYRKALATEMAENSGFILLAESGSRIVGLLVAYEKHDDPAVEPSERIAGFVSELYIEPESRKQGMASALLAEAEQRFFARGLKRMIIGLVTANQTAMQLYRRYGFTDYVSLLQKRLAV